MKNECTALELRKREELVVSIREGKVADPLTATFLGIAAWQWIITGATIAAGFLARALSPKPPAQQMGKLTGALNIQNSEQGLFIPEIYGAGPTVNLATGAATTWASVVHGSTGANGSITKSGGTDQTWDSGAVFNSPVGAADDAFIKAVFSDASATFNGSAIGFSVDITPASGAGVGGAPALEFGVLVAINVTGTDPATSSPIISRVFRVITNGVAGDDVGIWAPGDTFWVEKRSGVYRLYHDYAEITRFTTPTPTAGTYLAYSGWRTSYGLVNSHVQVGGDIGEKPSAGSGGCKVPAIIIWTSGIRKHVSTSSSSSRGGKMGGHSSTPVETTTYDIDVAAMFCRGIVSLIREYANSDVLLSQDPNSELQSGLFDATVGPDADYTFSTLPDPTYNYDYVPFKRNNDILIDDPSDPGGFGGPGGGSIQSGTSGIAVYSGTQTQLEDPTVQSATDAQFGTGSTPAYRGRAYIVHTTFSLSRWSGMIPNFTAVWAHKTLKDLDDIFASFFIRVGLTSGDYDFTYIDIPCRGLLISGRQFTPAEIMDSAEMFAAYNYFITEGEGKVLAYENGTEPTVTIGENEVGWIDGEGAVPDIIEVVNGTLAEEISLEKEVDFKYIDPGYDWDPNMMPALRRVTTGVGVKAVELHCTLTPDEAREAAQRMLYFDYVSSTTRSFTLPWSYLYLYPGYKLIINGNDGFTYTIRLTSISGGIGVLDCEGYALEPAVYDQTAVGFTHVGFDPNHLIAAMTILILWDGPTLRDTDESVNDNSILYGLGVPRTNASGLSWNGAAFYINRGNDWEIEGSTKTPGIIGKIVSASSISGSDPTVFNNTASIVVDLYGADATLSSTAQSDITVDASINLAVMGQLIFNFTTATQVSGYPNRWTLAGGILAGVRTTDEHIGDMFTNALFFIVSDGVVAFPMTQADIGNTYDYRAVTSGQSLDDAATVSFNYAGKSITFHKPTDFTGFFDDGGGDLLLEWAGITADPEVYELQITESNTTTVLGETKIIDPVANRHLQEYVVWDASSVGGGGTATISADGGVSFSTTGTHIQSSTSAEIVGGFLIEFQIPPSSSFPADYMSLFPSDSSGVDADHNFSWSTGGSYPNYTAKPENDFSDSPGPTINVTAGDRLGIYLRPDGIVEYHINYTPTSKPVWISAKSVQTSKLHYAYVKGGTIQKVSWMRQGPEFKYSASQQALDNGLTLPALPSVIYARVRQKSISDFGLPSDWTYGVFTR